MNLLEIDRLEMMRKRHSYFSAIAEEYTSLAGFIQAQDIVACYYGDRADRLRTVSETVYSVGFFRI